MERRVLPLQPGVAACGSRRGCGRGGDISWQRKSQRWASRSSLATSTSLTSRGTSRGQEWPAVARRRDGGGKRPRCTLLGTLQGQEISGACGVPNRVEEVPLSRYTVHNCSVEQLSAGDAPAPCPAGHDGRGGWLHYAVIVPWRRRHGARNAGYARLRGGLLIPRMTLQPFFR